MSGVVRDPAKLVPAFREVIELVLADLREEGHDPVVHETWRSEERAEQLFLEKKSRTKKSTHRLGLAVDCICRRHRWGCHEHKCDFFERWGILAERRGLTWGGRWPGFADKPHVQAIPLRLQALAWATAEDQRDTLVRTFLAGLLVASR